MRRCAAVPALLAVVWCAGASAGTPAQAVDAFHKALRSNDPQTVLNLLSADASIFEQGFAETSRDEWARQQLGAAIAFERDVERHVLRRQAYESGDMACVVSTTRTAVPVGTKTLNLDGAETAVLQREGGEWKIRHLHWSAHDAPATEDAAP